jgi:hypothetical protein
VNGFTWLVLPMCLVASGCASILDGSHQHLSVATRYKDTEVIGATCRLNNDKGSWTLTTPGSITVTRSYSDLNAECEKKGFALGTRVFRSAVKAATFAYMLIGGILGTAIDALTGAAYHYPSSLMVEMSGAEDLAASRSAAAIP